MNDNYDRLKKSNSNLTLNMILRTVNSGTIKWESVFKFVGAMTIILVLYSLGGHLMLSNHENTMTSSEEAATNRLAQYCNNNPSPGSCGRTFDGNEQWQLKHITLTIRHGDRTSIHSVPGSRPAKLTRKSELLDPVALKHTSKLVNYKLLVQESTIHSAEEV